ncbi:class I SAM-dependent methyltransferase [Patescibacteria group bacterium]
MSAVIEKPTFMSVKNRGWALETPQAKYLIDLLPPEIVAKLRLSFLVAGIEGEEGKELLNYFLKISDFFKMVKDDSTSAKIFENLYHKQPTSNPFDKYFVMGKSAIGIFQRLLALKANLPSIIKNEISRIDMKKNDKFTIFNMGSGPGHDMIEVLEENQDLRKRVRVVCVDTDKEMLEVGKKRVEKNGLADLFTFVPEKIGESDLDLEKSHLILLIGILCPMSKGFCTRILRAVNQFSRPDGLVLYSTVRNEMIEGDPLTDFLMRLAGWKMDYKTEEESLEIAKNANWEPIGHFYDSFKYNFMVVARKTE